MNKGRSDFLFATPTLISGAACLLDLYALYDAYNGSSSDQEADYKALSSDWHAVGLDIVNGIEQFERSISDVEVARVQSLVGEQMSFFP